MVSVHRKLRRQRHRGTSEELGSHYRCKIKTKTEVVTVELGRKGRQ